jgi:hypothetical protein
MARQREEELSLEAGTRTFPVEVCEKRILRFVEDDRRVEARPESIGEQGLAQADRPFDGDVSEIQGSPGEV